MLVAQRGLYIGERLRELRYLRALTQRGLSDISKVDEITISNLENNKRTASARTLRRLAPALGVEVGELTAGASSRDPRPQTPEEPGLTEDNRREIEAAKRDKVERDEETRREDRGAHDTGDRAP